MTEEMQLILFIVLFILAIINMIFWLITIVVQAKKKLYVWLIVTVLFPIAWIFYWIARILKWVR